MCRAPRYLGVLICFVSFFFFSCQGEKKKEYSYYAEKGEIFSTTFSIKYRYHQSLRKEIEQRLEEFDNSLNPFKSSSIISAVNNNEDVVLDSLFVNVVKRSLEVSAVSDGLFDVTISPLINAWGFGFKNMENINQAIIDSLKRFSGYQLIHLEGDRIVKKDPRVTINTSAIAKGYSVDVIAYLLESYGIEDYMIEIGGEVRARGVSDKNRCWNIAVTKPLKEGDPNYQSSQLILQLCDKSLATSGSYHKYYIKEGKKYAHTIDPRTGYPAQNSVLSATVVADDCMTADAFATVFMLADTAKVRQIANEQNLSYMLILGTEDNDFLTIESSDFEDYLFKK